MIQLVPGVLELGLLLPPLALAAGLLILIGRSRGSNTRVLAGWR